MVFCYPGDDAPVLPIQKDGSIEFPKGKRPLAKSYTVRHFDAAAGELDIDFVRHGTGVATTWALRCKPGDRVHVAAEIEPAMKAVDPKTGFDFEVRSWIPGLSLDPAHELTSMIKQLTGANAAGKVAYGTEGGLYQEAGIPTIVCGPGHIAQAHQPDEWIAQDQLDSCDAFIRRLAERFAT